jgi:hypothetical protein
MDRSLSRGIGSAWRKPAVPRPRHALCDQRNRMERFRARRPSPSPSSDSADFALVNRVKPGMW